MMKSGRWMLLVVLGFALVNFALLPFVLLPLANIKRSAEWTACYNCEKSDVGGNIGRCIAQVEDDVGPLPSDWVVLRNEGVSLMVHDPQKEFISQQAYEKRIWWSWEIYDNIIQHVGPYVNETMSGVFLEVGTNIGTVSARFAKEKVPVLTVEANPDNYVRARISRCLNGFDESRYVMVNRAIAPSDDGPDVYIQEWDGNMGTSHTMSAPKGVGEKEDGLKHIPPITLDSLVYGMGPMSSFNYGQLDLSGPIWGMKLDCEGCEGVAIATGRQLLHDPLRHPIVIKVEITPRYLKDRGGVTAEQLYRHLGEAGYLAQGHCPAFNNTDGAKVDSRLLEEHSKEHIQWECVFIKRRM